MISRQDVISYIEKNYHTKPEYIFKKFPNYCVFKHQHNGKWYGLLMDVSMEKLGLTEKSETTIIDLKVPSELIGSLIKKEGFYKAYHMNKEHWITVDLMSIDDTKELFSLIDTSYTDTKS